MYNKVNVKRHVEQRRCLNYGKEWTVIIKKECSSTKRHHFCSECNSLLSSWEKKKLRQLKDPEYDKKVKEGKNLSHKKHIVHYLWFRAKQRAKKYNLEFNITEDDIIIPSICPILEVPIILGNKGDYEYMASLDRIDNSKGYIKGNVMVISKKANSMKNSASLQELKTFCKNILRYSLNTTENECSELQDKQPVG